VDRNGFPVIHHAKRQPVALARPAPPRTPPPLLDGRRILTLRQAAEVLQMEVSEVDRILVRASLPRTVGWDAEAVRALGVQMRSDATLRAELGVERQR
jgi:predicted DNA-binding transcriptional regulator AlpA